MIDQILTQALMLFGMFYCGFVLGRVFENYITEREKEGKRSCSE